ncbi:uncharacterized protein [Antedon mediterranea]|uniref:uncharacterized protein n=1 Tax=Antedon mediterranea TaxID=105859 RepID=UPI003AF93023
MSLLKVDSQHLMIYRPGTKAEYLKVNNANKLCATKSIEGQDGLFVVNKFLNDERKQVCAVVHKDSESCITSSSSGQNIELKNGSDLLNNQVIELKPDDNRFFYLISESNTNSWLFQAVNKPDTYLAIENGDATLIQSEDPSKNVPGAFLKIVKPR